MKHILFIDPLNKLNPKKDTSLMLALTMKEAGVEVALLFEEDFYIDNKLKRPLLKLYAFTGKFEENGAYLKEFSLKEDFLYEVSTSDVLHMRIDPPFDTRYLRYLWMLKFYQDLGIKIVNSADGILKNNEKMLAYRESSSLDSYIGSSKLGFQNFIQKMKEEHEEIILKPLDLYQGYGVEKLSLLDHDLLSKFEKKVKENHGAIVAQPFCKDVVKGEIRSIYFNGKELGSILKVPKSGEYLANIAQGASFHAVELEKEVKRECDQISRALLNEGVTWIAYDIMGKSVSEVNITCPGLLVEVSYAHQQNLAKKIVENF